MRRRIGLGLDDQVQRVGVVGVGRVADGGDGIRSALDAVLAQVSAAIDGGARIVVLSDRESNEQLAPIPAKEIAEAVSAYPNAEIVWVQDEPKNQGAWPFMYFNLPDLLESHGETRRLRVVSRPASASPAGSPRRRANESA